jgi:putative restriction endonuclease
MATNPIIFGEISGIKQGDSFKGRKEMVTSSFHRSWGKGIDGNGKQGVAAIVLSGGYEDDKDLGAVIIYTGAGGNDPNTGKQVEDQSWLNTGNAGLLTSMNKGYPVRVIRGHKHKSKFSPASGYTYGGLYSVVDAWVEIGKSNKKICRYKLVYCGNNGARSMTDVIELDYETREKKRKSGTVLRIVRDSKLSDDVKRIYNYECQVCSLTIETKGGRYAEGAHIKPLGIPHNGDDNANNLLCLCPNHHVMFDKGSFSVDDKFNLIGISGKLNIHSNHHINLDNFQYHRSCHGFVKIRV